MIEWRSSWTFGYLRCVDINEVEMMSINLRRALKKYALVFCWLWVIKKFRDIFDVVMQTKLVAVLMFNGYVSFIEFYWYSIQRKCELDFMLGCGFPTWSFKVKILQKTEKKRKTEWPLLDEGFYLIWDDEIL